MRDPRLSEALPELLRDGLLDPQQVERIRAKYAVPDERSGTRMLLLLAILGSLLVGLGIILIVAHNWDDLPRSARTVLAFLPVLLGQGLLAFAVLRRPEVVAWREGSALLLACGLCASVALISQIYHIHGELEGYLLLCCALILPLLYIPGSIIVALGYLALVLWHGVLLRTEHFGADRYPWSMLLLLLAALPFYLQQARRMGGSIGFWWLSLFMAITSGVASQLFYTDWSMLHVLVMLAIASAYTLVPWLFPVGTLRTWPWVLVGGLAVLILFFAFSFRPLWEELIREGQDAIRHDAWALGILGVLALVVFVIAHQRRRLFERWPYPEALGLFIIAYIVGLGSAGLAAILVNLSLLAMGVVTVRQGIETGSLKRMNLGLLVVSLTILLRFFDSDLSFVLRGLVFIAIGLGFLYMNLRMMRQRQHHEQER
jgi:uncharacterized membrane protein